MSNLDRRTSRSVREKRAYRLIQTGSVTGIAGVVTLLMAIVGVVFGYTLPILLLIISALCAYGFLRTTGKR